MRFRISLFVVTLFSIPMLLSPAFSASAQSPGADSSLTATAEFPEAPQPQAAGQQKNQDGQDTNGTAQPTTTPAGDSVETHKPLPQPKRILGLMPNYRAVSAGTIPPPPTSRQAFKIATQNSFDYSSFVFVGITSLLAEGTNAHPSLGKGVPGFWGYYWRGFVDKADGNYWVIWIMPSMTREDERFYAKGEGSILDRGIYAASRVLITPNYHGKNTFNASEILGRGISQSISLTYYPSSEQSIGPFMEKYGYALGRDALTDVFREFWPDIDAHVIHRHHVAQQGPE